MHCDDRRGHTDEWYQQRCIFCADCKSTINSHYQKRGSRCQVSQEGGDWVEKPLGGSAGGQPPHATVKCAVSSVYTARLHYVLSCRLTDDDAAGMTTA
jgi:hypothetical protein